MEEIYKQNARIVYHFLYSMCKDEALAEELTQETFLRAFQSIQSYDGSCKLSTWLCQIGKHLLYQTWEKKKREIPVEWDEEILIIQKVEASDTERKVLMKIELEDVLKDISRLPEAMRQVIYLRAISDLSYKEIGRMLGKSENWARINFYRGKELLLKRRKEDEGL
ncbi:MAG: RNA polymerase sigma factor [Lachnospiraceae bacterium]|nr:RNA polymerase sigma factor [Lachnospiraceae bacterium]